MRVSVRPDAVFVQSLFPIIHFVQVLPIVGNTLPHVMNGYPCRFKVCITEKISKVASVGDTVKPQTAYSRDELKLFMLPEKEGSKLPSDNMSMIDRVTHISALGGTFDKGEIVAQYDITPDKWFFECHFPGDPVMPGCLGLDALWQLSGFYLSWAGYTGKGRALGCGNVKFFGEILPTTKMVEYRVNVRRIINKDLAMIITDGEVHADGKHIYSAEKLRVALLPQHNGSLS